MNPTKDYSLHDPSAGLPLGRFELYEAVLGSGHVLPNLEGGAHQGGEEGQGLEEKQVKIVANLITIYECSLWP